MEKRGVTFGDLTFLFDCNLLKCRVLQKAPAAKVLPKVKSVF